MAPRDDAGETDAGGIEDATSDADFEAFSDSADAPATDTDAPIPGSSVCAGVVQAEESDWPGTITTWDTIGGTPLANQTPVSRSDGMGTFFFHRPSGMFVLRGDSWDWSSPSCGGMNGGVYVEPTQDMSAGLAAECPVAQSVSLNLVTKDATLNGFLRVPGYKHSVVAPTQVDDTICADISENQLTGDESIYCRSADGLSEQWQVPGHLKPVWRALRGLSPFDSMGSDWTVAADVDWRPARLDVHSRTLVPIETLPGDVFAKNTWFVGAYDPKSDVFAILHQSGPVATANRAVLVGRTGAAKIVDLATGTLTPKWNGAQFYTNSNHALSRFSWQNPTLERVLPQNIDEIVGTEPTFCYTSGGRVECQPQFPDTAPCVLDGAAADGSWRTTSNSLGQAIVAARHGTVHLAGSTPRRFYGLRDGHVDTVDIPSGAMAEFAEERGLGPYRPFVGCRVGRAFVVYIDPSFALVWFDGTKWKFHAVSSVYSGDSSCDGRCLVASVYGDTLVPRVARYCWDDPG